MQAPNRMILPAVACSADTASSRMKDKRLARRGARDRAAETLDYDRTTSSSPAVRMHARVRITWAWREPCCTPHLGARRRGTSAQRGKTKATLKKHSLVMLCNRYPIDVTPIDMSLTSQACCLGRQQHPPRKSTAVCRVHRSMLLDQIIPTTARLTRRTPCSGRSDVRTHCTASVFKAASTLSATRTAQCYNTSAPYYFSIFLYTCRL